MKQCDSHRTDFREISYFEFLQKFLDEFRFWLKFHTLHEYVRTFIIISRCAWDL